MLVLTLHKTDRYLQHGTRAYGWPHQKLYDSMPHVRRLPNATSPHRIRRTVSRNTADELRCQAHLQAQLDISSSCVFRQTHVYACLAHEGSALQAH